jgi:hypothetical protein
MIFPCYFHDVSKVIHHQPIVQSHIPGPFSFSHPDESGVQGQWHHRCGGAALCESQVAAE